MLVHKTDNLDNYPVQLMFGLTNACNLHCAFCPYCGFCMEKIEKLEEIPIYVLKKMEPFLKNASFINPSGRENHYYIVSLKNLLIYVEMQML